MQVLATQMQIDFSLLAFFFFREIVDGEDDCDINDMIEMALDSLQLVLHVFTDCGCQFEVMSTDCEIHTNAPMELSPEVRAAAATGTAVRAERSDMTRKCKATGICADSREEF